MQKIFSQIIFVLLLICYTALATADIQKGMWELEIKMHADGIPFPLPPYKLSQCMSKDKPIPKLQDQNNCTITKQNVKGNTADWEVSCASQQGQIKGSGSITFNDNTLSGRSSMHMQLGEKSIQMHSTLSGRRTGNC